MFVFILVFWQFQVAMPVDMARHGLGPAEFGRVLAVNGVMIAVLQPFLAPWAGRFRRARVLAAGSLLVGLGYGAYALCTMVWQYALATAVWSLGEILLLPVASAVVADLSPEGLRGRYQGAFGLCFGLGMLVSPVLGAVVLERLGATALWAGCLGVSVAVAAAHLALRRS
jgi:MFS family permease